MDPSFLEQIQWEVVVLPSFLGRIRHHHCEIKLHMCGGRAPAVAQARRVQRWSGSTSGFSRCGCYRDITSRCGSGGGRSRTTAASLGSMSGPYGQTLGLAFFYFSQLTVVGRGQPPWLITH